jgi:endonuclease/exonuclease/phosphatase (EEP) superfamily protein YafD
VKVISWNLLRRVGAAVEDVAALIAKQRPDLLLMQEATREIENLPALCGGHLYRAPLPARIHGLAAWSPRALSQPAPLPLALPVSPWPGRVLRVAQIVRLGDIALANVHLSHGQVLNRLQLNHIATLLQGPAAIIGDFNAVGPTLLPGFRDVGPRTPTHIATNVLALRLDRCVVRGLRCLQADALDRGPSDHSPIIVELVRDGIRVAPPLRRHKAVRRLRAGRAYLSRSATALSRRLRAQPQPFADDLAVVVDRDGSSLGVGPAAD